MEWERDGFVVTTSQDALDIETVRALLHGTYWAQGRTAEEVAVASRNSLCFSLLRGGRQVGFARAVTDRIFVAWILDVVIDPEFRGQGLGKWLISCMLEHPELARCIKLLRTRDAHELYRKFKFTLSECMELQPDPKEGRPSCIP
jgi:GNAT superfamily N-acetyltransferase